MDWTMAAEMAFERGYKEGIKDAQQEWAAEKTKMQEEIETLNVGIAELHHILELVTRERI